MGKKVIIYLANLANTGFGLNPSTVPLEIGYLKSYALAQLPDEVEIQLFRTFESLQSAIQAKEPDIIGCAWYTWNESLTVNALTYIKSSFPNIITVVGGANAPEKMDDCLRDLKAYRCIDIIVPNEGEISFVNLLKVFISGGKELVFKTAIDGAVYLSGSQDKVIAGSPVPMTKDINIFPSPYLGGYLDQFLSDGLMPIIQTGRGCPFHCSFCVSARDSWNSIRIFGLERVKAEIDYLAKKAKNRTLRFTDENFGIVPSDLEIAEYIAEKKTLTGYPSAVRVYTHKKINDRIKKITLLLKDYIPMNISAQTLTEPVLNNIGRQNISVDEIRNAVNWGHQNNIIITTECIFGLPGETYGSFMNVINQLVKLRFDSVAFGTLIMLKETEINTRESISKYGYKTLYSIAEGGYTKAGHFENVETYCWAVENNFFSFDDFIKINLFNMIYSFFMFFGYFKEAVYIWENRDVKIADIISEFFDNPSNYPFLAGQIERLKKCLLDNLFTTKEEAQKGFIKRFSENDKYIGFMSHYILRYILMGEMMHPSNQEQMIDEVFGAAMAVFNKGGREGGAEYLEEEAFAKSLVRSVVVPFWETPQELVTLSSPFDLMAWQKQDYKGTLSEYALKDKINYVFKIRSVNQYHEFIADSAGKPFHTQSEKFFREFRSNNVRRFMV